MKNKNKPSSLEDYKIPKNITDFGATYILKRKDSNSEFGGVEDEDSQKVVYSLTAIPAKTLEHKNSPGGLHKPKEGSQSETSGQKGS